jgi:hypothetical protein
VLVRTKKPNQTSVPPPPKASTGGGTIITDTKRNKVGFFGSIVLAIQAWVTSLKKGTTKKRTPTYTVTDVERRKGIVQKATSKTGSIFTADNETLKEEIKRRGPEVTTKQPPHDPDITWSPYAEAGYALLEEHTGTPTKPHNVTVAFKKPSTPESISLPREEEISVETTPFDNSRWETSEEAAPTRSVSREQVVIPEAPPQAVPEPTPYVVPQPTPELTPPQPPILEPEPIEINEPIISYPEEGEAMRLSLGRLIPPIKSNTNTLTLRIAGAILTVVVLAIIGKVLVSSLLTSSNTPTLEPATPLISHAAIVDKTLPTLTREAVIQTIQATPVSTVTEFRFIDSNNSTLKPSALLNLLGFTGSKNLMQVTTDAHVVLAGSTRGVVIKVTDPTTALGALLSWEPTIVPDLATTLAIDISDQNTSFIDKTVSSHDIRVTSDATGNDRLVYGFVGRDTVLITKSTTDFVELLGAQ